MEIEMSSVLVAEKVCKSRGSLFLFSTLSSYERGAGHHFEINRNRTEAGVV